MKVVVSTDVNVRDQIIRATNNQSLVEPQSLRATDKVQRDIEEVLERRGWYYERRKNYFRNIGKPPARFVTPLYIAAGSVALVMRNPDVAGRLKGRFMRNPEGYTKVFSEQIPIDVWPVIADVLKRCEEVLATVRPHGGRQGERFLARSRNLLGLLAVARVLHTFAYSVQDLATFDTSMLTDELLHETWEFVLAVRRGEELAGDDLPSPIGVCRQAAKHFGLDGVGMVGQQTVPLGPQKHVSVTEAFIERVNQALPPQPWPPGTHFRVAQKLVAKASKVSAAIQELIARGKWHAQRDGVVTDAAGNVVAVDRSRVPEAPKLTDCPPKSLQFESAVTCLGRRLTLRCERQKPADLRRVGRQSAQRGSRWGRQLCRRGALSGQRGSRWGRQSSLLTPERFRSQP